MGSIVINLKNNLDLNKISFELYNNKLNVLLFENENHKKQLCEYMSNTDSTYNGMILLDGNEIYRNEITYLKATNDMLFNINILEDLKYGIDTYNSQQQEYLFKLLGLDNKILNKNYMEISMSEYRKICIVKAFLKDSKIILLDNPTIGLDEKSIQGLIKVLKAERRKNSIVIIISNNSDFLLSVSDCITIIKNNGVKSINNKYEFFEDDKMLKIIGMNKPNIIKFYDQIKKTKNIKMHYRDNFSDLLKEVLNNV